MEIRCTFGDLCFDVLLMIAEMDQYSFIALRSVNRDIRDYTNIHMDKYKSKFSRKITEKNEDNYLCIVSATYYVLPNGIKHGQYSKLIERYGECFNGIVYKSDEIYTDCCYKDGVLHGVYEETHTYKNKKIMTTYNNGVKHGICEKYRITSGEPINRLSYKNGKLEK